MLDAVADAAYSEAIKAVAIEAIHATQEETQRVLEKGMRFAQSPESGLKQKERDLVHSWLGKVSNTLKKRATMILEKVIGFLRGQPAREAARQRIREQARPAVQRILQEHRHKIHDMKAERTTHHHWEER